MPPDTTQSERARSYVAKVAERLARMSPGSIASRIESLVAEHDTWRAQCLNLNPAESSLSRRAREVLASDMATRLSEGVPGDKLYPHGRQNRYIDEIEAACIAMARQQFGASYVEWRPLSTTMAIAGVMFSFLKPGDLVFSQSEDGGGNYSYHRRGPAGLVRARILDIPSEGEAFEIDVAGLRARLERDPARMIVIGGSNVLFPYPVGALREMADRAGALLVYDAAHLGLLVSAGDFQRPLDEGAHLVVVSTHKIMGGPVGGLILTNDADLADRIQEVMFPGLLQTRDQNKLAALAIALAESMESGTGLARRMVANARSLGAALADEGFRVVAAERGFTQSHQVFLDLGEGARRFESRCQVANMLVSDCALTGDTAHQRRTGARIATHEVTRLGMGEQEMKQIARLMARAAAGKEAPDRLAGEVRSLLERFATVRDCFDAGRLDDM